MPKVTANISLFNVQGIWTHATTTQNGRTVRDLMIIDDQGNSTLITCEGPGSALPIFWGTTGQPLPEPPQ